MNAGRDDVDRAASALASRLPWPLAVLGRLAYNYRWSWLPDGPEVFRSIDSRRWRLCGGNPISRTSRPGRVAGLRSSGSSRAA